MPNVKNGKAIQNITLKTLKSNRTRNLFAIIAITLTCILFTALCTIVSSLTTSMEESTMRQVGSSDHGTFKYLSQEEYDKLRVHDSISSYSSSVVLGIAENKALNKRPTEIRSISSEEGAKTSFASPTTGTLPQHNNEIATDTLVLKALGIPAKIGEQISLTYSLGNTEVTETFILSGFWEGDPLMMASMAWLHTDYVNQQLDNYTALEKPALPQAIGTIGLSINFTNSWNIESKIIHIIEDSGFSTDDISYGINWAYMGGSQMDFSTILSGIVVILLIGMCGYLMISNVFLISITTDIKRFGLLKTIGTTGKQIKKIVKLQAFYLCVIGIPIGLICGFLVGRFLSPIIMSILSTNIITISIHPTIFIFASIFTLLTVFISVTKPANLASKVSPIEALRSADTEGRRKKSKKRSKVTILKMAFFNVIRTKKKAMKVTLSLSLSLIILNVAFSIAQGFDMDEYLSSFILNDFNIGDVSNFNVHIRYDKQTTLNENFLTNLNAQEGVEKLHSIYFSEVFFEPDENLKAISPMIEELFSQSEEALSLIQSQLDAPYINAHVYGFSDDAFQELDIVAGSIDLDKLKTGNYVIGSAYDPTGKLPYYDIGDKIMLPLITGDALPNNLSEYKEYEVLAIANIPYPLSVKHSHPLAPDFYFPKEIFLENIVQKDPMLVTLDVADENISDITDFLTSYVDNVDDGLDFESKATLAAEYENTQTTFKIVGLVLSSILGFIGVMNFTNTSLTSITARKRELAALQSMGLTNKQLYQMLIGEGLIYTLLTTIFTITIGYGLGLIMVSAFAGAFSSPYFTIIPSLFCLPILIGLTILIPFLVGRIITKDSIIERLRTNE